MNATITTANGIAALAIAALAVQASAETYWLKSNAANSTSPKNPFNETFYTNSAGATPAAITSSDVLHAEGGKSFTPYETSSFGGVFHAGAEDGSSSLTFLLRQHGLTISDLRWHSATIQNNYGKRTSTISGSATLDNPSATHVIGNFSKDEMSGIALRAALTCADTGMSVRINSCASATGHIVIAGDNSGYLGNFVQNTATTPLELASVNALGSPTTPRADALSIAAANAVLCVRKGVLPNSARGVAINASGFRIRATTLILYGDSANSLYGDCTEFELPMPISGNYGFTKDGTGTVTLSGAYTAGDIAVEAGTLHIAATATFPAGQNISVATGASLVVHQSLSGFTITAEDGAMVERVVDPIIADYDPVTTNATPVAVASTFAVPAGYVQPLALSSAITLPFHETLRLEVLTVAAGADDLSADDFEDNTEKTYGLPNTTIEVEKDGDGVQHVYLVAKPVVKSTGGFSNDYTLNGAAGLWSDGKTVHTGADYLIVHAVAKMGNENFGGDSLTVRNEYIYTRDNSCKITKATIYAPTLIQQNRTGRKPVISGDIRIAGSFDDTSYVTFSQKYNSDDIHRLSTTLSGEGPLKVTGYTTGASVLAQVYGNNSAYKGRIYVTNNSSPDEYTGTKLGFNSTNALGGALDEFRYNALTLDKFSLLCPTTTMTLQTENRGIYGSGSFGFKVPSDATLTVKEPIRADYKIYKHGGGDLLLGGELSFGASSQKTCYVREGGIGALNDAAVAGLDVVFSNATKIVIADDASLVNGFTGTLSVLPNLATGGDGKVVVSPADGFVMPESEVFDCAICTAPSASGDLSPLFTLVGPKGFGATLKKQNVELDGVPCVRYSVTYQRVATFIMVR